jgi:hypothetical protein
LLSFWNIASNSASETGAGGVSFLGVAGRFMSGLTEEQVGA